MHYDKFRNIFAYEIIRKYSLMAKKSLPKPTEAELAILQVLWENGPSSVRFIHEQLSQEKEVGYTTTLKIMQIMAEKGLLQRNTDQRTHIYYPALEKEDTQNQLLRDFVASAFKGSAMQLVMQALGNHKASDKELQEIKALIEKMEKEESLNQQMMAIEQWIPENWLAPLGWTVLHSLWQAAAVAASVFILLRIFPKWDAARQYWLCNLALWSIPLWSALTFLRYFRVDTGDAAQITLLSGPAGGAEGTVPAGFFHGFSQYFQEHLPLIVAFWLLGFTFFGLKLMAGMAYTHRLKYWRTGDVPDLWLGRF